MGSRRQRLGERVLSVWAIVNWLGIALGLVLVLAAIVLTILAVTHH
jgi:membrane protein YdbS with pleckstrin-like domain